MHFKRSTNPVKSGTTTVVLMLLAYALIAVIFRRANIFTAAYWTEEYYIYISILLGGSLGVFLSWLLHRGKRK